MRGADKEPRVNTFADMVYVTNQRDIVEHAKYCMHNYPTIVNNIPKEKNHYSNTAEDKALVDYKIASANMAIGESSNLAQLCLSYTYNYEDRKYYEYVCVLSVLAQLGRFQSNLIQKVSGELSGNLRVLSMITSSRVNGMSV